MIVRRDFDFIRDAIEDGMVRAAVAEFQFVRFAAERETENLLAEADAEDRASCR